MTQAGPFARPRAPIHLSDEVREFLDDIKFATITTIDIDGSPRQAVVWYRVEGDEIVINSLVGRIWPTNLLRDARIAFSVIDPARGYRWIGAKGVVTVVEDQPTAQADIAEMCRRYHADDPVEAERLVHERFERQPRISFRIIPHSISTHLD